MDCRQQSFRTFGINCRNEHVLRFHPNDLLNLKRKEDLLRKDLTTAERDITFQKAKIKKLEYDAEQYREKTYRRDKME